MLMVDAHPVAETAEGARNDCALCGKHSELRTSHVLPAFVYRWLRQRGSGHIRHSEAPNKRVQDGLKLKWLCNDCETRFSCFETAFATKFFYPWLAGKYTVAYEAWLLKFCVSLSWRVLRYARGRNKSANYSNEQQVLMTSAEQRWRSFLLGELPHPAEFEQHLLIFDTIGSTSVPNLPPNMNRFMTGAVTLDIVGSQRSLMTFAKLGRFIVFGIIQKGPNVWEGTKIHVKHGLYKPQKFVVPAGLLDLFREKTAHASDAMQAISPAQQDKIDANVLANLDRFMASDHFASIMADAEMFGEDAILRKS